MADRLDAHVISSREAASNAAATGACSDADPRMTDDVCEVDAQIISFTTPE
ncbi:MAG: hypothetical protein ACLPVF_11770 [Acidimicrobiales bacterium]